MKRLHSTARRLAQRLVCRGTPRDRLFRLGAERSARPGKRAGRARIIHRRSRATDAQRAAAQLFRSPDTSGRRTRPGASAPRARLHAASADKPVTMADVAAAAGCGTRTLLNVFRRFRETTPLAAMHDIRLQHARAALLDNPDGASRGRSPTVWLYQSVAVHRGLWQTVRADPGETRRQS